VTRSAAILAFGASLLAVAAWAQTENQATTAEAPTAAAPAEAAVPETAAAAPRSPAPPRRIEQPTPMQDRIATIGILNKQNGIAREIKMKPGQAVRLGAAIVRLKACETTPSWEQPPLTGAFLQLDVADAKQQVRRVFSGWTFAETPSLNPVSHPIYDVWVKSCTMRFPEAGPETVVISSPRAAASSAASSESSAKKSPETESASESAD